jgi:hypothetical protein
VATRTAKRKPKPAAKSKNRLPKSIKARKPRKASLQLDSDQQLQALGEIQAACKTVDELGLKLIEATKKFEDARKVKKGIEADHLVAVEEMQKTVHKWTGKEPPNLFNPPSANGTAAPTSPAPVNNPPPVDCTGLDESWRSVPLSELIPLGLPKGKVEAMAEHRPPLECLGDVTDYLKNTYHRLQDVKGFGQAAVDKFDDALEKFWAKRKAEAKTIVNGVAESTKPLLTDEEREKLQAAARADHEAELNEADPDDDGDDE